MENKISRKIVNIGVCELSDKDIYAIHWLEEHGISGKVAVNEENKTTSFSENMEC